MSAATCNIRWWDNNALVSGADITYSSQQSSFPGSNVVNDSRSKVWSPAGNFEITTSNQKVYIGVGVGVIPVGFYTGTTLADAIETQLNLVDSSPNWTVTYSTSTAKFTLVHTGFRNLSLSTQTDAIWDTIGFVGTTNKAGVAPSTFESDEQRNHTDEWVMLDYGVAFTASCMSLISLIDQQFPLSTNATIKIQGNGINLWTAPSLDITATRTDRGVFNFFDDLTEASRTFRYWRIQIIDKLNPLGPEGFRFSRAYIGDHSTTNTNVASGFTKPVVDPSSTQRSESGAGFFEEKIKYQRIQSANYQVIAESDRVYLEQLYQDFGKTVPLFVSVDPQAKVSTDLSEFTYYGNFDADPTPRNLFRDKWQWTFSFREAV